MNNGLEIRWHGRGGQGAKTAALLLADVAFKTGKYVQGFPEYGPERMGAPITAYNRISDEVIRVHSNIYTPGLVVVVDETLLHSVDVTAGLKEDGAIIVNTPKSADEIKPMLNGYQGKVYTVDARKISVQALGKYFPNSPMLAAAVAVSGIMKKDAFISEMRASYQHKFAKKPEVIDGNMQALELTYEELKDWYGRSGLPLKKFFNTSGMLYKEMKLKDKLPTMSEDEQLQLLSTNGMLVKRPVIVNGDMVLTGFKVAEWEEKLL